MSSTKAVSGNYVAEWFGHRVWPQVDRSHSAMRHQAGSLCPFLSAALRVSTRCIKTTPSAGPTGVCSISSDSNGPRQDWLACPYRTLDQSFSLLSNAVATAFKLSSPAEALLVPVTVLAEPSFRRDVTIALANKKRRVFAFSSDKLGGEVDLPETESSPGGKVDFSVMEIVSESALDGVIAGFGKHLFFEIQTADFHGSPLHAVALLRKLCGEEERRGYHEALAAQADVAGTKVEGPNKSNIFKRTFYQLVLKILMAEHEQSAGLVLVLPTSVWGSWVRHLGRPTLTYDSSGQALLDHPSSTSTAEAWIVVFDIDSTSNDSPQPLRVVEKIRTSADALAHFAFHQASKAALEAGVIERFRTVLQSRVHQWAAGGRRTRK